MKMPPTTFESKNSRLLTPEENQQVFKLLGNRCQSISTAVVQLYYTEPPHHSRWIKRDVGVLCFVKDNIRKNYFFRIFCLNRNDLVWEQEMYNDMEYIESTQFLHTFEGENSMNAFNFADINEANEFKQIVDDKITIRKKREVKRARQSREVIAVPNPVEYRKKVSDPVAKLNKRKRNITKADIGSPLDFKHVSHVGWNPDSGFDIDSEDDQLKFFFEKAGISEKQLQDRDTKEFIYDFILRNGGKDAILQETTHSGGRKAPAAPPPPSSNGIVPPVPPRATNTRPHVRIAPPPPPPSSTNYGGSPKPPPSATNYERDERVAAPPPPPVPSFGAPSPPPPPPPPAMVAPPVGDFGVSSPPPASGLGSALLDSIKSGTTLKHVDLEEKKSAPVEDSRNDLLSEIRKGTKLRPVCEREVKPISNVPEPGGQSLAAALARALAERSKAIHSEDDDDSDSDFNEDDWEGD